MSSSIFGSHNSTSSHKTHPSVSSPLPIITTTVYTQATAPVIASHTNSIPVGAIVGGICAGAFLAIFVTAGWIYWGKTIDRSAARHQKEIKRKRYQHKRPATLMKPTLSRPPETPSTSSSPSPTPTPSPPPSPAVPPGLGKTGKKVTFAPKTDKFLSQRKQYVRPLTPTISKAQSGEQPVVVDFGINLSAGTAAGHAVESTTCSLQGQSVPKVSMLGQAEMGLAQQVPAPSPLRHEITPKASTISSSSIYSTASGEERQSRVPPNLIIAALGSLGSGENSWEGTRSSTASNGSWRLSWSHRGFFGREDSGRSIPSQVSQNSLRSVESSVVQDGRVGIAL